MGKKKDALDNRLDTGEIVTDRKMRSIEMQKALPFDGSEGSESAKA